MVLQWFPSYKAPTSNFIMAVSFIGGGNQSTRRKPLTLSHNAVSSKPRHAQDSNFEC